MNEEEFCHHVKTLGYGEPRRRDYEPNKSGDLHTHDFAVILMVLRGSFALAFENHSVPLSPGEITEVGAGVLHDERAGPEGATVLLASKQHMVN